MDIEICIKNNLNSKTKPFQLETEISNKLWVDRTYLDQTLANSLIPILNSILYCVTNSKPQSCSFVVAGHTWVFGCSWSEDYAFTLLWNAPPVSSQNLDELSVLIPCTPCANYYSPFWWPVDKVTAKRIQSTVWSLVWSQKSKVRCRNYFMNLTTYLI